MDDTHSPNQAQPASSEPRDAAPLPDERPMSAYSQPAATGMQFDPRVIISTLFKHKWKIIICFAVGLLAALQVRLSSQPTFASEAKLLIKYLQENHAPARVGNEANIKEVDPRGDAIISTEMEILTSMDLAQQVVAQVGPERILDDPAAADQHQLAAIVLHGNLAVDLPSRTALVIRVTYKHPDRSLAQTILQSVIEKYQERHLAIHRAVGDWEELLTRETDDLRENLKMTEEEIRKIVERTGWTSVSDARKTLTDRAAKLDDELTGIEAELAERRAIFESHTGTRSTPRAETATIATGVIPPAKVAEYQDVLEMLAANIKRERDYRLTYTDESYALKGVRGTIEEYKKKKTALEAEFPALLGSGIRPQSTESRNVGTFDREEEEAKITGLISRGEYLKAEIQKVQRTMVALNEAEPKITDLLRAKNVQEERYLSFTKSLDGAKIDEKLTGSRATNITVVQSPSAPMPVRGEEMKLMAAFIGGGLIIGLGLTFLLEMVLNQSVRRPVEIEGNLGLPLFFSIPFLKGIGKPGRTATALPPAPTTSARNSAGQPDAPLVPSGTQVPPWSPAHGLREYFDALRDRLVFYFEIRNFTRKPKLIAVAGCGETSGVSTIAAGLAASLSESGDGNVLLVDMNPGNQTPFRFHKGELKCDLDDALEQEKRDDAMVQNNLYVVSHATGDDKLTSILPKRFTKLLPKLKASDFDYIIFDLPPVNQISATPQLARYMDMLLMVVESEKTARETTKRVGTMFAENGVNFGVILNKTREYIPRSLRGLLTSDA
jgi:uncharacterized protein involved in exopolysaccharide biosynthesis/Mrp family chromosome partitioning ATPase